MKHAELMKKMSVYEKAAILSGQSEWTTRDIERLGIPSIFCSDGPHGIRKQTGTGDHLGLNPSLPATCFPTAATVANSWDTDLAEEIGNALGEEAAALGVNILLGPGLNIKRNPLCGRNFEYFSEDPFLSGKMAAAYVRGIQKKGVYACPKHFAVNSQELRRMTMNAVVDERTLREIYLTGFEIAVKEGGARAVMTSYNEVNGTYANENEHLLKEILRGEWGFDGIVITDWGGSNDHVRGVAAGSNLEMPAPGLDSARQVLAALDEGTLSMDELDACVDDLLEAVLTLTRADAGKQTEIDKSAHHALAKKAAAQSIVLLKNTADPQPLLPLGKGTKAALIGDFAVTPRYQGAGSSVVNPLLLETMENIIGDYPINCIGCAPGYARTGQTGSGLKEAAINLAKQADVVIYCLGLDEISEAEGMDRSHMQIPQNQVLLLEELAEVNPNIIGVVSAGSSIDMHWECRCRAILHGYLGGQAGAGAMLDVLTGKVNPSGKLSETYPIRYEDTPSSSYFPSRERNSEYRESIFVGYRFFDTNHMQVRYPFGYGLSYTTFEYSNLTVTDSSVRFEVANTGKMAGAEICQMYIGGPKGTVFRPLKELKGFCKVYLKPQERKEVEIRFDDKSFRFWNIKTESWEEESGTYDIYIGSSVSEIRLTGRINRKGTETSLPYKLEKMPHYFSGNIKEVPDEEFERLLGHPIPSGAWDGKLGINDAVCQMYYAKSGLARLACRVLNHLKAKNERKGRPDLNLLFIYNIPFRAIAKMTGGAVSMEMAEGLVHAVNGHFFKGMKQVISGYFSNKRKNKEYERKLRELK